MRKLILLFIALTLGIGAWAQETQSVSYIDANGQQQTVTATVVTNETGTLNASWYVVTGEVSRGNITCNGAVHLILADGANLTATGGENQAGITVSGEGNSLTIYGQNNQTGQLTATGGSWSAGIGGGGENNPGSNITINGGKIIAKSGGAYGAGIGGGGRGKGSNIIINGGEVNANGGAYGAGIGGGCENGFDITINGGTVFADGGNYAAGIGGGDKHPGSNITINGGSVKAASANKGAGIGGGMDASGSNIKVSADCNVFAGDNSSSTTKIQHDPDSDIASAISKKRYVFVIIEPTLLSELQTEAISAINETIVGVTNTEILAIAQEAKNKITSANSRMTITSIKDAALAELQTASKWFNSTKAELLGELGTEKAGTAVKVTKDEKEVILYAPDKVEYIIRK